jgi:hypothetical protein
MRDRSHSHRALLVLITNPRPANTRQILPQGLPSEWVPQIGAGKHTVDEFAALAAN